jgi:hypothetical protein
LSGENGAGAFAGQKLALTQRGFCHTIPLAQDVALVIDACQDMTIIWVKETLPRCFFFSCYFDASFLSSLNRQTAKRPEAQKRDLV